jgi:hypothetical protein
MEKYPPMSHMHMPHISPAAHVPNMPNMPMPQISPATQMPINYHPVTLHASYEEINLYGPKKHHHHHCHCPRPVYSSAGIILVLFILLVIILRSVVR